MEHIEIYATAIGTIGVVIGTTWAMTTDAKKQIGVVFRRFDAFKKNIEGTHVSKEICNILHTQIKDDIVEIKQDVKKLLQKNGIK